MSILLAAKHGNKIYVGSDSYVAADGGPRYVLNECKFVPLAGCIAGFGGSVWVEQAIRTQKWPKRKGNELPELYLHRAVAKALHTLRASREDEFEFEMIAILDDHIFSIDSTGGVTRTDDFIAIGAGEQYAVGAWRALNDTSPKALQIILDATIASCPLTAGPTHLLRIIDGRFEDQS